MILGRLLPFAIGLFLLGTADSFADPLAASKRIDDLIDGKLKAEGIQPNAPIDDAAFLRRAHLNIGGRIPTIEEAEAFHASDEKNKRTQLIDELIGSEAYVSHFYNFWADILRIQDQGPSRNAFLNYQLWVKKALRENMPYDRFVYELVSARGKTWENGATGYYHRDRGMPLDNMSNTVRVFLGTRLECAQCHDHPFDDWTQMDYYQMAAFSYGIDARDVYTYTPNRLQAGEIFKERVRKVFRDAVGQGDNFPMVRLENLDKHISVHGKNPRDPWLGEGDKSIGEAEFRRLVKKGWDAAEETEAERFGAHWAGIALYYPLLRFTVADKDSPLELPHDYQYANAKPGDVVSPAAMFGKAIDLENSGRRPIEAYAEWLTARDNPTFTRVIANRLWKRAFGIGIIEPADDLTELAQPSNPELIAYLEELMRELNYDLQAFQKVIFNTNAWQRAADRNEIFMGTPYHFAGPVLRRMSAEQIWDSLVALSVPEADRYRPLLNGQLYLIERERLMWTSLEGRTLEEHIEMLETLSPLINERDREKQRIQDDMLAARQKGDTERLKELKQAYKEAEKPVQQAIREIGYIDLHNASTGKELLGKMGLAAMDPSAAMAGAMSGQMNSAKKNEVLTALPAIEVPKPPEGLAGGEKHEWEKQQQKDLRNFKVLISKMARASELESPAPRGHFLRDFGQSDREVIENAADHASVPQALNLLNGPMIEALTNRFAVFGRRIHAAESPEAKTRIIFQAMLTREPSNHEKALVESEIAEFGEEAFDGIVWALLNTQQFRFVE